MPTPFKTELWSKRSKVLLAIVALLIAILLWVVTTKKPMPELTTERLRAAKALWAQHGPHNYSMDVAISGVQHGRHHIIVEKGLVVSMTTDGSEVPKLAWEYWNVEGMFRFLSEEMLQSHTGGFGSGDPEKIFLAADFETTEGYPKEYLRQVFGANATIHWVVSIERN